MSVIRLEGMSFYAHHGCFDAEQVIGTRFLVDIAMVTDSSLAEKNDNIEQAVNYADVYQTVAAEMRIPSHLLEHVAGRIGLAVMHNFQAVTKTVVKVSKLNPPIGGPVNAASVELTFDR